MTFEVTRLDATAREALAAHFLALPAEDLCLGFGMGIVTDTGDADAYLVPPPAAPAASCGLDESASCPAGS